MACGIFHLLQAILVLGLGLNPKGNAVKFKLPLTTLFLDWSKGFPVQKLVVQGYLPFVAVTSGFSWMSAVAHFFVLVFFSTYYIPDLRKGINRFRWIEYAFSSSLMIGLIAMLFGMYDIISLVLIMSVNATMNLFGFLMETTNVGKKTYDWNPFTFGGKYQICMMRAHINMSISCSCISCFCQYCFLSALAGAVPWACIFAYIGGSGSKSIPAFVFGILAAYLFMFNVFPVNMILQYTRVGCWSDSYWGYQKGGYYFGEVVYQILSLVAKSLLLWLVYGGSNQPNPGY